MIGNDTAHYTTYSPTMVSVELLVNLGFVITQMFAQLRETKFTENFSCVPEVLRTNIYYADCQKTMPIIEKFKNCNGTIYKHAFMKYKQGLA